MGTLQKSIKITHTNMQTKSYIDEIMEKALSKPETEKLQPREKLINPEKEAKMNAILDKLIERRRSSAKVEEQKAIQEYQQAVLRTGMRMDASFLFKTNEDIMSYLEKIHR